MNPICMRTAAFAKSGGGLNHELAKYITSSGHQRINIGGNPPTSDWEISMNVLPVSTSNSTIFVASPGSVYNEVQVRFWGGVVQIICYNSVKELALPEEQLFSELVVKLYNPGYHFNFKFGDKETSGTHPWNAAIGGGSIVLFSHSEEGSQSSQLKLADVKVSFGEDVKRRMKPVVKIFDGIAEGCLYDEVSDSYFRNIGTGTFGWETLDGTIVPPT